jgi:hypothetical protein
MVWRSEAGIFAIAQCEAAALVNPGPEPFLKTRHVGMQVGVANRILPFIAKFQGSGRR